MKKTVSNKSFKRTFKRNAKKVMKMNVAPFMYRGGIRL